MYLRKLNPLFHNYYNIQVIPFNEIITFNQTNPLPSA